ncbi:MAG: caspase family protein [Methylococcales bacterium]|nr:caspase family protein [Methylococcales bacterium]MBT7443203.1 caspase family protein [Methylococcales bacterium]
MNRPGVVLSRLGLIDGARQSLLLNLHKKRLARAGVPEQLVDLAKLSAPKVVVSKALKKVTHNNYIDIPLSMQDEKQGLTALQIKVNSIPVYPGAGLKIAGNQLDKTVMVKLSQGINRLQILVSNQNGVNSSIVDKIVNSVAPAVGRDLWVVAIGVSDYENDQLDLNYAAKDATDLTQYLAKQKGVFDHVHTAQILNKAGTKEIIKAAKSFVARARVDDTVMVFFSGHGFLDAKMDYYFGTTDIDPYHPVKKGLPYDDMVSLLAGIDARKRVLFIDSCHSGEVDEDNTEVAELNQTMATKGMRIRRFKGFKTKKKAGLSTSFELLKANFADLTANNGAIVLSASTGNEYALENGQWKNGVFTFSILEAMSTFKTSNVDVNKNQQLEMSELRDYVYRRVNELTFGQQQPTTRQEPLGLDFRIH